MSWSYDDSNIFARILAGEIPCNKVLETDHSLAFRDIHPQAPVHVLVIPKGRYVSFDHFAAEASDAEIVDFTRAIARVSEEAEGKGYRLISNTGEHGHQDVAHLHVHVVGGRRLGSMLKPREE